MSILGKTNFQQKNSEKLASVPSKMSPKRGAFYFYRQSVKIEISQN